VDRLLRTPARHGDPSPDLAVPSRRQQVPFVAGLERLERDDRPAQWDVELIVHAGIFSASGPYDRRVAISDTRLSWLRVPSETETAPEAKELWEKPLERLGFVPNVLRAYALRLRHLELWNAFYEELMRG